MASCPQVLLFQVSVILMIICLIIAAAVPPPPPPIIAKPGCKDKCGDISIPYPFGIGDGCSIDNIWFNLNCNNSINPPKLFMVKYEILNISLQGEAKVKTFVASECYNSSGFMNGYHTTISLDECGPYTFSNTRSKFTAIGCDTQAYITGYLVGSGSNFTSGCVSFCSDEESLANDTCSGIGCCQTSIPVGAKEFDVTVDSPYNHSQVLDFNPCSYAFLTAEDSFKFNRSDLTISGRYRDNDDDVKVEVVVDWAIGNETCELAQRRNLNAYACKSVNSTCYDSTNGPGYRCNCSHGYTKETHI